MKTAFLALIVTPLALAVFLVISLLLAWEPYLRARAARRAGNELPEEYAP